MTSPEKPQPTITSPLSPEDKEKRTNLGNLLLRMRAITSDDLEAAVLEQATHGGLLGELLWALGYSSASDVQKALELQARFRSGRAGDAALELMERDLEALVEGERKCTAAIECARQDQRDAGEASGEWFRAAGAA